MNEILKNLHFASYIWLIALPCLMMAVDIVTGLTYAWVSKTFDSARMRAGLGKKFGEVSYIVVGLLVTYAMMLPSYIVAGIATYIVLMELMSIIENCDKLGTPMPKAVKDVINNVNDSLNNDSMAELTEKIDKLEDELHDKG